MRYLKLYILFFTISVLALNCKQDKADTTVAGKGGNASLVIYPQHHGVAKNLRNMKIYVKYNTSAPPSSGAYDDSVACTLNDTFSVGTLSGLKNGDYYLYGYGYDTSIFQNVKGGIPYTISVQGGQNVQLPVSED